MPMSVVSKSLKRPSRTLILSCLVLTAVAASALDLPDMKPGLWQTTVMHSSGKGGRARGGTMSTCLDAATQATVKKTTAEYAKANCSKNENRRDGAAWVTDMVCKAGGRTTITHSVTTFASDDAYHTEMTFTFDPPTVEGQGGTTMDGKWMGACKSGKP
jgi:hypothetical protein